MGFSMPMYIPISIILWALYIISALNHPSNFLIVLKKRELIVILVIIPLILSLHYLDDYEISTNSKSGEIIIKVRTLIGGRRSWEVPWIAFDYLNDRNFYYIVLHKGGLLELSRVVDGVREIFIDYVETDMTPYEMHTYILTFNEDSIVVKVDGRQFFIVPRLTDEKFIVRISRGLQGNIFWVAWISLNLRDREASARTFPYNLLKQYP